MKVTRKDIPHNDNFSVIVDGIKYIIYVNDYLAVNGYASCIIRDTNAEESYMSNGRIFLNGHTFITTFGWMYDPIPDQYRYNTELTLYVDEEPSVF